MKKVIFLLLTLTYTIIAQGQNQSEGMTLLANWNPDSLPAHSNGQKYTDLWGHTDCSGNEYAILGSYKGVHFFNVNDPASLVEIDYFPGGDSTNWRDIKTYKDRAYAVSDNAEEGLMIFDLSDLPNSISKVYHSDTLFLMAHNIFLDEDHDRLYVVGAANADIMIYDLRNNPDHPELLAELTLPGGYIHDIYVRDHIAYCSHLDLGLNVYDFTDPSNPITLGSMPFYPGKIFNHSSWLTEDGQRLVFCDEKRNTTVKIIDVSDPTDMEVTAKNEFKSTLLAPDYVNSIAHNPYVRDDYVVVSYYHDGVQIFDISDPDTVTRVAYYDTQPNNEDYSGWFGAWGAYPYLPSGNILVSDMHNGLFVFRADSITFDPMELDYMPDVNVQSSGAIIPCEGDSIILSVPDGADTYVWYKDSLPIGATNNSLVVYEGGNYWVEVNNGHCQASSENVALAFSVKPDLSAMLSGSLDACENETIIWEAPANIGTYVWLKNGNAMANSGSFIQIVESGSYRLLASNNGCTTISEAFEVNFIELPGTLIQAEPFMICPDGSTTLSVEAGAEIYTWYFNGELLGSSAEPNLATSEPGEYSVEVSIGNCNRFSEPIELSIAEVIVPEITLSDQTLTTALAEGYQWYFNGAAIEAANEQQFTPSANGTYQVEILDENGCNFISEGFDFISTSTDQVFNQSVELLPNPVNDQLFLKIDGQQNATLQLRWTNLIGQNIYEEQVNLNGRNQVEVYVPQLSKGIYLLQIDNGTNQITRKVLKQ